MIVIIVGVGGDGNKWVGGRYNDTQPTNLKMTVSNGSEKPYSPSIADTVQDILFLTNVMPKIQPNHDLIYRVSLDIKKPNQMILSSILC